MWDACPVGLPAILTVAYMILSTPNLPSINANEGNSNPLKRNLIIPFKGAPNPRL